MTHFGIKRKLLLVLVGVLLLTTTLDALLASYFTDRQNQEMAFVALNRSLRAWHDDLESMTVRLKGAALSTVGDTVVLNQLTELILLEPPELARDARPPQDTLAIARALSYAKAVSLNRLHLALRTSGFSRIAVYTGGKLSYAVSASRAGMMVQRGNTGPVWVTALADSDGNLDFQSWPAWQRGPLPASAPSALADVTRPTASFSFPTPTLASIDIVVPVQGVFEEYLSDFRPLRYRLVSGMSVADPTREQPRPAGTGQRQIVATLVFSRLIDSSALGAVAAKTGMAPELLSPDGSHRQHLGASAIMPDQLVRAARRLAPSDNTPAVLQQTVVTRRGSFYAVVLPWRYEHQTRMILGLSSSRESTLRNIGQTVSAILFASGMILVLSIGVGMYWVGRFIDPIVALTKAVKQIGKKRRLANPAETSAAPLEPLEFVAVAAPDEIGELSAAFNVMTLDLKRAFDTLELRVQARTGELRQQTRYLRTLIDTLPLWVWLKDTERRYLAVNQANAAACGHRVDEMVGKSDEQLWPPELAERFLANDAAVMTTRQRTTVEQAFDGPQGMVWMETYRAPVLDDDGTLLGMVGVARNVSERRAAEAAREAALAEAVRLARQRSDFLAQMSHELRTPLNAIMGYAQLLRRDTHQLTERQAAGLATIHESGQHLLTLINDILDMARVEAGKLVLFPAPTHLVTFLRVVADIMRVKAEEKSLLFSYELRGGARPARRGYGGRQAPAPGAAQSAGQRRQVHRPRRGLLARAARAFGRRGHAGGRPGRPAHGAAALRSGRQRDRHERRAARPHFPALRAGRRHAAARGWHRPGPGHQPATDPPDGRDDRGQERAQSGQPVLVRTQRAGGHRDAAHAGPAPRHHRLRRQTQALAGRRRRAAKPRHVDGHVAGAGLQRRRRQGRPGMPVHARQFPARPDRHGCHDAGHGRARGDAQDSPDAGMVGNSHHCRDRQRQPRGRTEVLRGRRQCLPVQAGRT